MAKADYHYFFKRGVLCIVDEDRGNMSITNDIEDVVFEICEDEGLDRASIPVIYQDSDGNWDGYDTETGLFVHIGEKNVDDALELISYL